MQFSTISNTVREAAQRVGFDLCGIAGVGDHAELARFTEWIEAGYGGEMEYLKSRVENGELKRSSLKHAAPWAKSVVVCAINYNSTQPYSTEVNDPARGWISRYAWTREDYHDAVMRRLRELESELVNAAGRDVRTWCYVDTGPVVERVYAKHAGIGWIGKNTCIINEGIGSWLFLGVLLTSLELQPDTPALDRCGTCTACIDACPTDALRPYHLDANRCISYLTIEKRGSVPEELRAGIGRNVYGCDICQDVCPWNNKNGRAPATSLLDFQPREDLVNPALDWLAEMSRERWQEAFRRSPIKRTKYSGMRRNVAIAMGNSGDARFVPHLEKMAADEDASVAEHARWAIKQLASLSERAATSTFGQE